METKVSEPGKTRKDLVNAGRAALRLGPHSAAAKPLKKKETKTGKNTPVKA